MATKKFDGQVMQDLQGFFRPGQRKALYNSAESLRDKLLIRLLWKSGRRVSEILDLKVGDIDFEENNIQWHIRKKKNKNLTRVKPMDEFTIRLLLHYVETYDLDNHQYIFFSSDGEAHLTRQRVFQIIRDTAKKANITFVGSKRPHPHHFRHSFAVSFAKNAKSPSDLRKLQLTLEHASLDMTEQYLQFNNEDIRDVVEIEDD